MGTWAGHIDRPRLALGLCRPKRHAASRELAFNFGRSYSNLLKNREFNIRTHHVHADGSLATARVITATSTTSRAIQFGLKLLW